MTVRTTERLTRAWLAAMWTLTFVVGVAWVAGWPLPFALEAEPLAMLLGMVSTAVTALFAQLSVALRRRGRQLAEEEYSVPRALAYSYVNNFLDAAVAQLLAEAPPGQSVTFYVYIPVRLDELDDPAVQRTLARVRALGYRTETVQLRLPGVRPRDVLTVMRADGGGRVWFDFPGILRALRDLIDYKLETQADRFPDDARDELGARYIRSFHEALEQQAGRRGLLEHVRFIDRNLEPLKPAAAAPPP